MNSHIKKQLIASASKIGYSADSRSNGKLICLRYPKATHPIFVDAKAGGQADGAQRYFKVAVHPQKFVDPTGWGIDGLAAYAHPASGKNTSLHSGYSGFPPAERPTQHYAKAYIAQSLKALAELLIKLSHRSPTPSGSTDCFANDVDCDGSVEAEFGAVASSSERSAASEERLPPKGLVIAEPWISMILDGKKTWEMRSRQCELRGEIALIAKGTGTVVGVARIVGCQGPLKPESLASSRDKHCITESLKTDGEWMESWNYAWVLDSARRFEQPVWYKHPSGAVTWVNLDNCVVAGA